MLIIIITALYLIFLTGKLHVQLHNEHGNGEAFVHSLVIPINKWIHVSLTVGDGSADITVDNIFMSHQYISRYFIFPASTRRQKDVV